MKNEVDENGADKKQSLFETLKSVAPITLIQSAIAGSIALIGAFCWWLGVVLFVPFALYTSFNFFVIAIAVLYEMLLFGVAGSSIKNGKRLENAEGLKGLFSTLVRSTLAVFLIQAYLLIITIVVGTYLFGTIE